MKRYNVDSLFLIVGLLLITLQYWGFFLKIPATITLLLRGLGAVIVIVNVFNRIRQNKRSSE